MSASGAPVLRIDQRQFILPFDTGSMNKNVGTGNWKAFSRTKSALMDSLALYLHELDLPRPIPHVGPVLADALFTFTGKRGQESENYRVMLSKALGDVLRCDARFTAGGARFRCGYLLDDKDTDWRLQTSVNPVRGPASVRIRLAWFDRPVPEPVAWVLLGLERGEITREELAELLPAGVDNCAHMRTIGV